MQIDYHYSMSNKITRIYSLLYLEYGPQGWWPLTEKYKFIPEHSGKKPNTNKRRFEIIVGAILTQNTSWKNVEKAIYTLNSKSLLNVNEILNSPQKNLAEAIRSSGYYNQKAIKLKTVAEFLKINKFSTLKKTDTKQLRNKFLSVKGIGPETADSILLYALEKPIFVVDAYTKRLVQRLGLTKDLSYESVQKLFETNLPKDYRMYKEYHALIVEHAKRFCTKKPKCNKCTIRRLCANFKGIL